MSPQTSIRKLTLADIADVREYERGRDEFRAKVMQIKRRRRLSFGTIITLMFENRDTMLLQIQEMARVEKLATDDEIQVESFATGPVRVDIEHPDYLEAVQLSESTHAELLADLTD